PDDAAGDEQRAAWTSCLPASDCADAELTPPHGRAEAGHPRAGNGYFNEKVGLCSTYSIRTRSGPQTNTARVFAASTTFSTMPIDSASSVCSSAESTRTAR